MEGSVFLKVLWTINNLTREGYQIFYGINRGGLWIDNYLAGMRNIENLELVIVTSSHRDGIERKTTGNVTYYLLPGGDPIREYDVHNPRNVEIWRKLLEEEAPDLIQIWGTEGSLGLAAQLANPKIKTIVYIQGLVSSLKKYCLTGISNAELFSSVTLRGIVKGDSLMFKKRSYQKSEKTEQQLLRNAYGFIYENQWCYSICKSIAPQAKGFRMLLPIADAFTNGTWEPRENNHTIMCPFMYDSFKGFHVLLKAFSIVLQSVPDSVLLLPGDYRKPPRTIQEKLKQDDYSKLTQKLIAEYALQDHIEYTGYLTPDEMAEKMKQCGVFVMCSTIENHASTLKEAMSLGVPCISSDVGGVNEYVRHERNALIYRCEDHELLASYIIALLENQSKAEMLGSNAREEMREYEKDCKAGEDLYRMYLGLLA